MLNAEATSDDLATVAATLEGLAPGSRIVVAMSGGVDSSVTASLLKQLGYDVVGITLQLYDHGDAVGRKGACCAGEDIRDARRVADRIGIPHYVLDYEGRFRSSVIDAFADSYLRGETPIPCVLCNQRIKFGDMAGAARELGAQALVTGHYVGWRREASGPVLHRAADSDRDQSYFLFSTPAADLDFLRFPLGGLTKPAVRRLALAAGLSVAEKADSQDICFVPGGRYAEVIERLRPGAAEPGEIVHVDGRVLGKHNGILHFTVGQRKGLGIPARQPLYVVALEPASRRVVVGPREMLLSRRIELTDVNWLGGGSIEGFVRNGGCVHARTRSTGQLRPARLICERGHVAILLDEGEHGVARGQACVLYADGSPGARLLGGGWIASAENLGTEALRQASARKALALGVAEQRVIAPG
ncbi:MAG: tRNA 2-thiouridine(34) synthase MnmA [Hyphomicrobiaceae bacterium]